MEKQEIKNVDEKKRYSGFERRYQLYDHIKAPVSLFNAIIAVCAVLIVAAVVVGILL